MCYQTYFKGATTPRHDIGFFMEDVHAALNRRWAQSGGPECGMGEMLLHMMHNACNVWQGFSGLDTPLLMT